jgi:NFU1 iron-sulfur cluster scaffold homolog, mitochondrial
MVFAVREIQPTPNPNAMKYVLDQKISDGPASFYSLDQAKGHLLATRLLSISGVSNVMLLGDFVTVGKLPSARWSEINGKVKRVLAAD